MAETTTGHRTIRKWAEAHGGKPAAVQRTHNDEDTGIVRVMFPESRVSAHDALVEISWEEFFCQFEESKLALVYEKDRRFNKVIGRETANKRARGDHQASRQRTRDCRTTVRGLTACGHEGAGR
jgi:hypothetical protein